MLMTILDHTLKRARSVQPDDVHNGRAFRVLKTAVRDVLQTYRTEYDGEWPSVSTLVCINLLWRYKLNPRLSLHTQTWHSRPPSH